MPHKKDPIIKFVEAYLKTRQKPLPLTDLSLLRKRRAEYMRTYLVKLKKDPVRWGKYSANRKKQKKSKQYYSKKKSTAYMRGYLARLKSDPKRREKYNTQCRDRMRRLRANPEYAEIVRKRARIKWRADAEARRLAEVTLISKLFSSNEINISDPK